LEELKHLLLHHAEPIRPNRKNKRDTKKYRKRKNPVIKKNWKNKL
jgi:hypothetical protein